MLSKTLLSIFFSVIILSTRKKNIFIQQVLKDFTRFSPQFDDARVFACYPSSVLSVAITLLNTMFRRDEKSRVLFHYFITNQPVLFFITIVTIVAIVSATSFNFV